MGITDMKVLAGKRGRTKKRGRPRKTKKQLTFNIVGKDNEYYPIEMAEHLRGAIYEGPSNSANQVVSNLSNHGRSLYIKGGVPKWNTGPELLKVARHGVTNNAASYQFARRKAYLNALASILPKKLARKMKIPKAVSLVLPFGNRVMLSDDAEAVKTIYKAEFLANVHTQRDGTGRIMGGGMPVNRIYKNWQSWLMNDMSVFVSTLGTSDILKRLTYVATQNSKAPKAQKPIIQHSPDFPGGLPFDPDDTSVTGPLPSGSSGFGMPSGKTAALGVGAAAAAAAGYDMFGRK